MARWIKLNLSREKNHYSTICLFQAQLVWTLSLVADVKFTSAHIVLKSNHHVRSLSAMNVHTPGKDRLNVTSA